MDVEQKVWKKTIGDGEKSQGVQSESGLSPTVRGLTETQHFLLMNPPCLPDPGAKVELIPAEKSRKGRGWKYVFYNHVSMYLLTQQHCSENVWLGYLVIQAVQ